MRKEVDIHHRIVLNIKTQRGPSVTVKSTYSLFSLFSLNSFTGQPLCSADSIQSPIFITHCFSGIPRLPPFNLRLFSPPFMFFYVLFSCVPLLFFPFHTIILLCCLNHMHIRFHPYNPFSFIHSNLWSMCLQKEQIDASLPSLLITHVFPSLPITVISNLGMLTFIFTFPMVIWSNIFSSANTFSMSKEAHEAIFLLPLISSSSNVYFSHLVIAPKNIPQIHFSKWFWKFG